MRQIVCQCYSEITEIDERTLDSSYFATR